MGKFDKVTAQELRERTWEEAGQFKVAEATRSRQNLNRKKEGV